ncbi:MAG: Sugar-specific transcriptional regulator TrmB [Candidatus Parcubacteria bacterium]|jgi:predicted transcriptional regulator
MSRYKIDPFLFDETEKIVLKSLRINKTPLEISKDTNTPRSTVYFILEKLKKRGLVKKEKIGKKTFWILKKSNEIELAENQPREHSNIKIYDSSEQIVDFLYRFVSQNSSRFQFFNGDHNPQHWGKYVETRDGVKLNNLIRDNGLISDIISSASFIKNNENVLGRDWTNAFVDKPTEYHVLNSKYTNFNSQIILQTNKVFIMNMEKPVLYEISDPDIYNCFTSIFQFIKDNSKKVNASDFLNN